MPKVRKITIDTNAFKAFKRNAPKKATTFSVNHFKKSFRDEGFTDKTLSRWKPRKTKTKQDIRTGRRRAILTQSGALKGSIKKKKVSFKTSKLGSYDIEYAARHNFGITDKRGRKMPERQFIGLSTKLDKKVIDDFTKQIFRVFR